MNSILHFALLIVASTAMIQAEAQGPTPEESTTIPYPFQPPSDEFCSENKLGSDVYVSIFSPCNFTFYKTSGDLSRGSTGEHFSCDGIVNSTNDEIIDTEQYRVLGWPDSCVALGARCYNLTDNPHLSNFTQAGVESSYYPLVFPPDADFVSVDCSYDYELVKELPEAIEPLANAIIFFGIMVLIGSIIICGVCCCFCIVPARRSGYSKVGGIYSGPPVEARKMTV